MEIKDAGDQSPDLKGPDKCPSCGRDYRQIYPIIKGRDLPDGTPTLTWNQAVGMATHEAQDRLLGHKRAKLFRQGKIDLSEELMNGVRQTLQDLDE